MVFSGVTFLYYFLPAVIILYLITPGRFKNGLLAIASLFFYAWGEQKLVFMLIVSILIGYVFGILIERQRNIALGNVANTGQESHKALSAYDGVESHRALMTSKILLALLIIINLCFLGYFKYVDFFISNFNFLTKASLPLRFIALPIGISFYTFQILSYGVDVYRGDVKAERNLIDFAAYVSFFPQLIAGPIVRFVDLVPALKKREHSFAKISYGIRRFALGLGKKVILANSFAALCVTFREAGDSDVLFFWIYAVAFTLQIYFDFSGYSDMAIGLGSVFGFKIMENFNYPYTAASITDFWRRWHISLSSWFRDYVYIPMGGSRRGLLRQCLNILIVWMLTGFWHGAAWNFVLWGLMYAILLSLEKFLIKGRTEAVPVLGHIYVMFFVILGFVLFNADSLAQVGHDLSGLFGGLGLPAYTSASLYYLKSYAFIFILAILGATPIPKLLVSAVSKMEGAKRALYVLEPLYILALLVISTALLVGGSFNPFLYFRF